MSVLGVTGTGTGVGKTVVTAAVATLALARGSRVAVLKPAQTGVATGEPGDVAEVARLCGAPDRLTTLELARYPDPLAPAAAARRTATAAVDLAAVVDAVLRLTSDHDLVLVEGAGGLLVRFDDDGLTLADVLRAVRAPALVVCAAGLGTLNATALTLEALAHRGVDPAGVVVGDWPPEPDLAARCNLRDLETLAARPLAGAVPEGAGRLDPGAFLAVARTALGPVLGGTFDARTFRSLHETD